MTIFKNGFTMQEHQEWLLPKLMAIVGGEDPEPLLNILTTIKLTVKEFPEYNFIEALLRLINLEITEFTRRRS